MKPTLYSTHWWNCGKIAKSSAATQRSYHQSLRLVGTMVGRNGGSGGIIYKEQWWLLDGLWMLLEEMDHAPICTCCMLDFPHFHVGHCTKGCPWEHIFIMNICYEQVRPVYLNSHFCADSRWLRYPRAPATDNSNQSHWIPVLGQPLNYLFKA